MAEKKQTAAERPQLQKRIAAIREEMQRIIDGPPDSRELLYVLHDTRKSSNADDQNDFIEKLERLNKSKAKNYAQNKELRKQHVAHANAVLGLLHRAEEALSKGDFDTAGLRLLDAGSWLNATRNLFESKKGAAQLSAPNQGRPRKEKSTLPRELFEEAKKENPTATFAVLYERAAELGKKRPKDILTGEGFSKPPSASTIRRHVLD